MSEEELEEPQGATPVLAAVLVVGAVARILVALKDDGVFWPDEIYQSLEPAHRAVFGYGMVAWEFANGARHWTLPGFVAGLLELAHAYGWDHPREYIVFIRCVFVGIGMGTVVAVFRLARSLGADGLGAAVGAGIFSLTGFAILLAPRAMSETASALPLTLGLAWCLRPEHKGRFIAGTFLMALAVGLRLQSGYYCLGLIALLWARRERRAAQAVAVLLVGSAFVFGLVDKLTWGSWFHSAVEYFRFNVVEGKSGNFGKAPISYYAQVLWHAQAPLVIAEGTLLILAARRAIAFLLLPLSFALIHSFILHKEFRFLFPTLPLFAAVAGVGASWLRQKAGRITGWIGVAAALGASTASAAALPTMTFGRLGLYEPSPGHRRVLDDGGPENRLLWAAHDREDLCGLLVSTRQLAWTGGYSYLHRNVPLYEAGQVPAPSGYYNYAIVPAEGAQQAVARDGEAALVKLPVAACQPDPNFSPRLH